MQTNKPESSDIDLGDTELVHRYYANRYAAKKGVVPPSPDPALDEAVEEAWFAMGDQQSWIEGRPGVPRNWEAHRKP